MLRLRVNRRFLVIQNAGSANSEGLLNIIVAPLPEIQKFGATGLWLTRVARLILDPRGTGTLYTFSTQDVQYWESREKDDSWRAVQDDEPLASTIYEYCRLDQPMEPTKLSARQTRSVTTNTTRDQSEAFRVALFARYPACVISGVQYAPSLIASHLIPKRLGDVATESVFRRFTELSTPVTRFTPSLGILVFSGLDPLVDAFGLGFWHLGEDRYEIHVFDDAAQHLSITLRPSTNPGEILFHRIITLESRDGSALPPPGVFNWHYLQGIMKKFATDDYKNILGIYHFVYPFRTRDDDDDDDPEYDDPRNIEDPPYPSFLLDLAWTRRYLESAGAEQRQDVERWRSAIPHV